MTKYIKSLSEIVEKYDVILTDQWGVLHDGIRVYPGVVAALQNISKPVVIVSNSGKRSVQNIDRMTQIGLDRSLYQQLLTSGEANAQFLTTTAAQAEYGNRCYLISNKGDCSMLEGVPVTVEKTLADASFMLMAGSDAPEKTLEDYRVVLAQAAALGLPAICSNPDFDAVHGAKKNLGPGRLADLYQQLGGNVRRIGKPDPNIFHQALAMSGITTTKDRVLMIGDSLFHDIAGAHQAGFDTLLVATGLYHQDFKDAGDAAWQKTLDTLCQRVDARPDYFCASLCW